MTCRVRAALLAVLVAVVAAGCGSTASSSPESGDRLLLLAWNFPDTGVTRLLVQLHDAEPETGPTMLAPASGEVEATATLQSPAHTVPLAGSYYHDEDYFRLAHRSGADSIVMFGEYEPHPLRSPIIATMTYSGPPAGNGNAYGVKDTTGRAVFICATYALDGQPASHSFGLVVTDSLVIGLSVSLGVPFQGLVKGDSIELLDGKFIGTLSSDRSTVSGAVAINEAAGHWSGRRCGPGPD
ncbi:MAG: hypothetical protein ABJC74_14020 [Gemmatimonadota bacterium]